MVGGDFLPGLDDEEGKLPSVLFQPALDGHAQVEVADQDALVGRVDCVHTSNGVDWGGAAELAACTQTFLGYLKTFWIWFANQLFQRWDSSIGCLRTTKDFIVDFNQVSIRGKFNPLSFVAVALHIQSQARAARIGIDLPA